MQELIAKIGGARPTIDNGMLRVGPKLDKTSRVEALLTGGASRALSLADAVVQLCRQDHANESLPVLRQLAETACVMTTATEEAAADAALKAWDNAGWESLWPSERFTDRAKAAGFAPDLIEAVESACSPFLRANRAVIPWSHIYEDNTLPGITAASVLRATTRLLGRVVGALETRWPGAFPGAEGFEA